MGFIEEVGERVRTIGEQVGRSVVGVGARWGIGSGVVVAPGKVLTNAHNVRAEAVSVTFADGRQQQAAVTAMDVDADIAVLSVDTGDVPAIGWDGAAVAIGSPVFALSNPGGRGLRVTFGLVSGTARSFRGPRGRRISGSIEHTAPLLPGSSGGPVVSAEGELLGINTNRLGEGFYLAIPADESLREKVDRLSRGEAPQRRRLGVAIVPAPIARKMRAAVGLPASDGILVRGVVEDSPAARAGIGQGDLLVRAGDKPLRGADDLFDALAASGDSLEVELLRGIEALTVTVTF